MRSPPTCGSPPATTAEVYWDLGLSISVAHSTQTGETAVPKGTTKMRSLASSQQRQAQNGDQENDK